MDNNTARTESKVCTPPPITTCDVNNIQNLVCNLIRDKDTSYKEQLKINANGDIHIADGLTR